MNNIITRNSNKKTKFKGVISLLLILFASVLSLFTLTSCKWTNSDETQNASFDANGALRITTPYVSFHPNSVNFSGDKIVDDLSGSFTWDLSYYLKNGSEEQLKDIGFDQVYLLSNFFTSDSYDEVFVPSRFSTAKPVYASTAKEVLDHFFGKTNTYSPVQNSSLIYKNNAGKNVEFEETFEQGWYAQINSSEENLVCTFRKIYSKSDKIDVSDIAFPDFEVVIDGKYYTFQTILNVDALGNSLLNADSKNLFRDLSENNSLFTFKYRTGKSSNNTTFNDCPKGMMDYFVDDNGVFKIRFNPRLEEGSINRYLKVRALPSSDLDNQTERASSLYGATVSFEAYAMTFEVYSPNSTTLDYGGLSYDNEKYYFAYEKSYFNQANGQTEIKSLTGFFPEGRKVEVSRSAPFTKDYNYAFQSWTTNAKAENSVAIDYTFPALANVYNTGINCLENANNVGSRLLSCVQISKEQVEQFLYLKKSDSNANNLKNLVLDYLPEREENSDSTNDKLVLASHRSINGYKFYANYAKVRNFNLSGSFFAGDNFFTSSDQKLLGVSIQLFYKDLDGSFKSQLLNVETGKTTNHFSYEALYPGYSKTDVSKNLNGPNSHIGGVTITQDGEYFKVEGLEKEDYLIFAKEGNVGSMGAVVEKPYSFHSPLLVDKEYCGSTFKALDIFKTERFYTDKQDVGIIGTQYSEESNLIVNLYQLAPDGSQTLIKDTDLMLLQDGKTSYEVIKSVSSYEDENGYITTNIIISLILPSNSTLISYNLETMNHVTTNYYIGDKDVNKTIKYASFTKFNAETMQYDQTDIWGNYLEKGENGKGEDEFALYEITPSSSIDGDLISATLTSQYIEFNGNIYTYHHRTIGGIHDKNNKNDSFVYYVLNNNNSGIIEFLYKQINSQNESSWHSFSYKRCSDVTYETSRLEEGQIVNELKLKVDGQTLSEVVVSSEANEVSTIATAYESKMSQTMQNAESGEAQTNTIFLYYDIAKVGDQRFYTAPIGKLNATQDSQGQLLNNDLIYFKEITNFQSLKDEKSIMLGSDIYKQANSNSNAKAFKNALGSSIILNCYYYILPLGEPQEILFKQYISEKSDNEQLQTIRRFYYKDGEEIKEYKGSYDATAIENGFETNFMAVDPEGKLIDTAKYNHLKVYTTSKLGDRFHYASLSGNKIYLKSEDFGYPTHSQFDKSTEMEYIDQTTGKHYSSDKYAVAIDFVQNINGNSLGKTYTLYEVVDGKFVQSSLYYDGEYYHRIVGSTYVQYFNEIDEKLTTKEVTIYSKQKIAIRTGLKSKDEFKNSTTVTYFAYVTDEEGNSIGAKEERVLSSYSQKQYVDGALKNQEVNCYTKFIMTSFYSIDSNGNKTFYYPVAYANDTDVSSKKMINSVISFVSEVYNFQMSSDSQTKQDLYVQESVEKVFALETSLVRTAQRKTDKQHVTVLGKFIATNDQDNPTVYPSFSSLNTYSDDEAFILNRNEDGKIVYYSLDYTSKNNVIEGFPGVSLLAGIPYPNPVLYFSVRHKAYDTPVVNIAFNIVDAFYAEIAGTNIKTEDSNLIRDFTTYSFKDTIQNLTQNDYIDKAYYVLDKGTFKAIYALVLSDRENYVYHDVKTGLYYDYYMYSLNDNGEKVPVELSIQNIAMNEGDPYLYASSVVGANGKYYKQLYRLVVDEKGDTNVATINGDQDVLLWKSDSATITNAPAYDIHSYVQNLDGIIYFNSGSSFDDNIICNGLSGISSGATQSAYGNFNYDQVMLSGVTHAYRTLSSQVNWSGNMSGYQFDKMINILNAYDAKDAYFLTGKEAVVLIASPIVRLQNDAGQDYIYRFKEWQIYSRYNSEVLYYNAGETERIGSDRYNAILRFTSNEAGYFVMFPIYERVYELNLGTAVIDGALNQGGAIDISYKDGSEVDVESSYEDELYFVNYFKTNYQNKEGYYYGNLTGSAYLYFTGKFLDGQPVFKKVDNIYFVKYHKIIGNEYFNLDLGEVFLYFMIDGSTVKSVKVLERLESDVEGIVQLTNFNGQYSFIYNNQGNSASEIHYFENQGQFVLEENGSLTKDHSLAEIMNVSFSSYFFYDSITGVSEKYGVALHYDPETRFFTTLDLTVIDQYLGKENSMLYGTFINMLAVYNLCINKHIFKNSQMIGTSATNIAMLQYVGLDLSEISGNLLSSLLSERIAQSKSNYFTVMQTVSNPTINGLYRSRKGSLSSGELVKDENGNIYSTQQFKTAYIDRDSYVELEAVASAGYRFEGWYKCKYDEEGNFWYTTDEKVTNAENIYSDEIIQAYYNSIYQKYYYITDYYEVVHYENSGNGVSNSFDSYIYYHDSDKTQPAIVPDRMLDRVRGNFINTGTISSPNFVQVYAKGNPLFKDYYYEPEFINRVDTSKIEVVEKTFVEAINSSLKDKGLYTLSNVPIFAKEINNQIEGGISVRYYRMQTSGNIVVDGNRLIINDLHSNVRYVAKFIETYNEYIFAENEESSGISIEAVYYSNDHKDYSIEDQEVVIRTNYKGENKTAKDITNPNNEYALDYIQNTLDSNLFKLYEENNAKQALILDWNSSVLNNRYDALGGNAYSILSRLTRTGFGRTTHRVNQYDEDLGGNIENKILGKLNMNSMYFDVETTVYIVVRVEADYNLSIHSLGVNSKYELVPVIAPKEEFVAENQKAKPEDKIDYHYYMFKIDYNRDPENENASYLVHPHRGDSISYDLISGRYAQLYKKYVDLYDNLGNQIKFNLNSDNKITLSLEYLQTLKNNSFIGDSVYDQVVKEYKEGLKFDNVEEALYDLCFKLKHPGKIYSYQIRLKHDFSSALGEKFANGTRHSNLDDIFQIVKQIFKQENGKNPYLIRSGQRNFVNLSTIPVYNYTIQAITLEDNSNPIRFSENNKIVLEESSTNKFLLDNSLYTTGGTNGRTYIGSGQALSVEQIYLPHYGSTQMILKNKFVDIDYGGDLSDDKTLLEDLSFAQNSLILLSGIDLSNSPDADIRANYIFAGWYEQKFDRETQKWSDLAFMSKEETLPYLSLATADTVVVAIYKRAIDLSITYDKSKVSLELDNGLVDSNGTPLTLEEKDNNQVTLSGKFFFDANIGAILSLTGGYRFDGISFIATASDSSSSTGSIDLSQFSYMNYNSEDRKFEEVSSASDVILNGILKASFPLSTIEDSTKIDLTIKTQKLTLVYYEVENFTTNNVHSGYDFALVNIRTNETYFRTNGENFVMQKDSANNMIDASVNSGILRFYGYFDNTMTGELAVVTLSPSSNTRGIREWFINANISHATDEYEELVGTFDTPFYGASVVNKFKIEFEYVDDDKVQFNATEMFDLDKSNSIYYAKAIIDAEQTRVQIQHTISPSLSEIENAGTVANYPVDTLLSFSGTLISDSTVLENGAIDISSNEILTFGGNSRINLNAFSDHIIINGKLYIFVGWFYRDNINQPFKLMSQQKNISEKFATGYYEAKYVNAIEFDVFENENATVLVESQTSLPGSVIDNNVTNAGQTNVLNSYGKLQDVAYSKQSGFEESVGDTLFYALSGSQIKVDVIPDDEFYIANVRCEDQNSNEIAYQGPSSLANSAESKSYTFSIIKSLEKLEIEFTIQKGFVVLIKQTLFDDFYMGSDPVQLTTPYVLVSYDNKDHASVSTLREIVVADQTPLTFTNMTSTYYFIGFFINGELVSREDTKHLEKYSHVVDSNLVIEARYTKYAYFAVNSYEEGSSSSVAGFKYSLSYVSPRTNEAVNLSNSNYVYRVPAGIKVDIQELSGYQANPFRFTGFKSVALETGEIRGIYSKNPQTSIVLSLDKNNAYNTLFDGYKNVDFINIGATYQRVAKLTISKTIEVSESDRELFGLSEGITPEFNSLFDIILTYVDANNQTRSISLSSLSQIANIEIKKSSEFTAQIVISDMLKDRYRIDNISFKSTDVEKPYSIDQDNIITVQTQIDDSNMSLKVDFKPSITLVVSKELNSIPTEDQNIVIDYVFGEGENQVSGSLSNQSSIKRVLGENESYSLTASYKDGYKFIGWFEGSIKVSNNQTISSDVLTHPTSLIARFVAINKIVEFNKIVDGQIDTENTDLDFVIVGNVLKEDLLATNNFNVKKYALSEQDENEYQNMSILSNSKVLLFASHKDGLRFVGFRISNGASERFVDGDESSFGFTGQTVVNEDVSIYAVYETEHKISYLISSINSDKNSSQIGLELENNMQSFTASDENLLFTLNLDTNQYRLFGVYVNNQFIENSNTFANQDVSIPISEYDQDMIVEILVQSLVKVNVLIAVDQSADATVLREKGIAIDNFAINVSGSSSIFAPTMTQTLFASYMLPINSYADFEVLFDNNDVFTANGITYEFDGFYVYDGQSVASSVSPIVYSSHMQFMPTEELSVVAKFESKKTQRVVETRYSYEFIQNNFNTHEVLSSFDGAVTENVTTYNGDEYAFLGYYAKVNHPVSGQAYILLSTSFEEDTSKFDKVYPLIVAKFVRLVTVEVNSETENAFGVRLNLRNFAFGNLSNQVVKMTKTQKGYKVTLPIGSYVDLDCLIQPGFFSSNKNEFDKTLVSYQFNNLMEDKIVELEIKKTGINVQAQVEDNRVGKVDIALSASQDLVNIIEESKTVDVQISLPENLESVVYVGIYNSVDQTEQSAQLSKTNTTLSFSLPISSVVSLRFSLAQYECFDNYQIIEDTKTTSVSDVLLDYYTKGTVAKTTIKVEISRENSLTIVENNYDQGDAKALSSHDKTKLLQIHAKDGYRISQILIAENSSEMNYQDLVSNPALADSLFESYSQNFENQVKDDFNSTYLVGYSLNFASNKNLSVKVVYEKVYMVNFVLNLDEQTLNLKKYYFEDSSILTLENLSKIDFDEVLLAHNVESMLFSNYVYNGEEITSETQIDLSNVSQIEIFVNYIKDVKLRVNIVTRMQDNGVYATPTNGIKAFVNEILVSDSNSSQIFSYRSILSEPILVLDEDKFFEYYGIYDNENSNVQDENLQIRALSTSSIFSPTINQIEDLEYSEVDGQKVYELYAIFVERIQTVKIEAEYKNSNLEVFDQAGVQINLSSQKKQITINEKGNAVVQKIDGAIYITYPFSLVKDESYLTVKETSFGENTTDPLLAELGIEKFYEKTVDNQILRFDNFFDKNNYAMGEEYSNSIQIKFSSFPAGSEITAKAKTLCLVEFACDVQSEQILISLEILTANGGVQVISIDTRNCANSMKENMISYMAEVGTVVRVNIDYSGYADREFSTIVASDANTLLLSEILKNQDTLPTTKAGWKEMLEGYVPVSKRFNKSNRFDSLKTRDNTSSFNFAVTENISLVADFYGAFEDYRAFIVGHLSTIVDHLNLDLINRNSNNSNGFQAVGNGFNFTIDSDSKEYFVKESTYMNWLYILSNTTKTTYIHDIYSYQMNPDGSGINKDVLQNVTDSEDKNASQAIQIHKTQLTFNAQYNLFKNIDWSAQIIFKDVENNNISFAPVEFNGLIITKYNPELEEEKQNVLESQTKITADQFSKFDKESENLVRFWAPMVEGYFFKGFAIVSSNYDYAFDAMLIGGETGICETKQYSFIAHENVMNQDEFAYFVSKPVRISESSKVIAIYEPRVYVINLNTLKYNEDAVDMQDKMTDEVIEAGSVKGSLLVQKNVTAKLTSINYQFTQFVGFSTTSEFDDKIKFAWDQGKGLSTVEAEKNYKNNAQKLSSTDLWETEYKPGENQETGKFSSSSIRNNIYVFDINRDFTLNIYYTALSYNLEIDLTEILTTSVLDDASQSYNSDSYLTYAEYLVNEKDWKNPSAGKYKYSLDYGTNSKNSDPFDNIIVIDEKDPFVYVFNDKNNSTIGYPTKIANTFIDIAKSNQAGVLKYKTNTSVQIAKAGSKPENPYGETIEYIFQEKYQDNFKKNSKGEFIVDELYRYGFAYNHGETDKDGNYVLNNIFNYVDTTSGSATLIGGLFNIRILGEELININSNQIATDNLQIDFSTGKVKIVQKIIATDNGFPSVTITMNDHPTVSSVVRNQIQNITKTTNAQRDEEIRSGFEITGFNTAIFDSNDTYDNPDFKLDNIDVHLLIKWQQNATRVLAKLKVGNSEYNLMDNRSTEIVDATPNACENDAHRYLLNKTGEILSYQVIIVKNGYTYLNILKSIYEPLFIKYQTGNITSIEMFDMILASSLAGKIVGALVGQSSELGAISPSNDSSAGAHHNLGHGATGNLFTDGEATILIDLLKRYNKIATDSNMDISKVLTYRIVDAYELYNKGIHSDFYNSSINSSDVVLTQTILNEHYERQVDHKGAFGVVWTADKAYSYFREASGSWLGSMSNSSFQSPDYSNVLNPDQGGSENTDASVKKNITGWKQFVQNVSGLVNSAKKYAGTYLRVINIGIAPSDEDLKTINTLTSLVSIDTSKRIRTIEHDYNPIPVLNAVVGVIHFVQVAASVTALIIATGGAALPAIAIGGLIAHKIMSIEVGDSDRTIYDVLFNYF